MAKVKAVKPMTCPWCGEKATGYGVCRYSFMDGILTVSVFCQNCERVFEDRYNAKYDGCNVDVRYDDRTTTYMMWPEDEGKEMEVDY